MSGTSRASLNLVEDQDRVELAAEAAPAPRESSGATFTPPSPWIGSIRMAAVWGPDISLAASRSPYGPGPRPGGRGARAARGAVGVAGRGWRRGGWAGGAGARPGSGGARPGWGAGWAVGERPP